MTWARLDDSFHANRKIRRAWRRSRASIGLHVLAIAYCADHATDGHVDPEFVEEKLPRDRERTEAVSALIDAGLWTENADGWLIHDFLEFNDSAEDQRAKRRAKSDAGRKGAEARWHPHHDGTSYSSRDTPGIAPANAIAMAENAPDPTRHIEEANASSSEKPKIDEEGQRPEVDELCALLADRVAGNLGEHRRPTVTKAWRREARLLLDRDGRSVEEARRIIEWCQADSFWRTNVLGMPKLREQFDRLTLKAKAAGVAGAIEQTTSTRLTDQEFQARRASRLAAQRGVTVEEVLAELEEERARINGSAGT